jgi:TatD DNase family protein
MIDSHFHLEQPQYKDRDELIKKWKTSLKAVITSCAHPKDLEKTIKYTKKYKGFIFATAGLHPQYIKELTEEIIENYLEKIKTNSSSFVAIGEIGLDYHWIKDSKDQETTRKLFRRLLEFAKKLKKPVVVHNWEAGEDTTKILEEFSLPRVHMHMWGEKKFTAAVENNGWFISVGPSIFQSKQRKKIVRDFPLERIFLETDSPWFPMGEDKIGYPTNIKKVAERIAEIKNLDTELVWKTCGENTKKFFELKL